MQDILASNKIIGDKEHGHSAAKNLWSKKLKCSCGSTFNKGTYYKSKTNQLKTYFYQCYNQKNNGSYNSRLKRGISTEGACDSQIITEWKLELIINVIFDQLWKDRENIVEIANDIISETIKKDSINANFSNRIDEVEEKLNSVKMKNDKLLDMYLNEILDKEKYLIKKTECDTRIEELNNQLEDLKKTQEMPKNNLENKLFNFKNNVIAQLNSNYTGELSEDLIDLLVERVIVEKDKIKVKMNNIREAFKLDSLENVLSSNLSDDCTDVYLSTYIINNEILNEYKNNLKTCGLDRVKKLREDIVVELYI